MTRFAIIAALLSSAANAAPVGEKIGGSPEIAWNFNPETALTTAGIPGSAAPDVVGAFRFICLAGVLNRDDAIVYPGQPGASHGHQNFGNNGINAHSTTKSLSASGTSSCGDPVNRSAYWMPWMEDGQGNVVRPDYISIYYKRRPISDPKCNPASGVASPQGICVPIPNGLKMVFGYDMITGTPPTGAGYFNCQGPTARPGHYPNLANVTTWCPSAPTMVNGVPTYNQLGAVISAPQCWDGRNLDSPNHRSHVGYMVINRNTGQPSCPPTHPFVMPTYTQGAWYTVDANLGTWGLSCDHMLPPGTPKGVCIHADYFKAWSNYVERMWLENCINKMLNCSGGNLGNGKRIKNAVGTPFKAIPRLVTVP